VRPNLAAAPAILLSLAWFPQAETGPRATAGAPVVNSVGMHMVLVPAGTFLMGSSPGAPMRQEEEILRRVTLTRAFRIAATEVTQQQWLALMPSNPSPQKGPDLPVTSVSWQDARDFCLALAQKEGAKYRLPTEAEWECACRLGGTDLAAGQEELGTVAWYADNSEETAHAVGSKRANALGLFDMLGNLAEWTLDVSGPYPRDEQDSDPTGPPTGSTRVVRGGSWRSFPPALRCAARASAPPSYQLSHVGLRVVQEVE
jgi:formylglycine-generating enzyme required for sulfatase activity